MKADLLCKALRIKKNGNHPNLDRLQFPVSILSVLSATNSSMLGRRRSLIRDALNSGS